MLCAWDASLWVSTVLMARRTRSGGQRRRGHVGAGRSSALLAWGYLDQHHAVSSEGFDPDYTVTDAEAALDTYIVDALGAEAAPAVKRHAVSDLAPRALLANAEHADLLVVGARGLGGFRGLLLGSVSRHCLHDAKVPVAVIRPDVSEGASRRVVVGIDGSPAGLGALAWAADEARAREATLEVVHAWQPPYVGGYPFVQADIDYGMFEEGGKELMHDALAAADLSGLEVREQLVCSGPAAALLEASKDAQVVVVGARGVGRFERFLLGSVSDQVAQHAAAPVVVVHHPDAA